MQEKAITFPTDAKLYNKMREDLVKEAKKRHVLLRQSYSYVGKYALLKQNRYAHARQMKRAQQELRKLKNYLGRVTRDIIHKVAHPDGQLNELICLSKRLLAQKREDKNKLYSLHAPEVECIAKGKAKAKYEFGCKVAVTTTCKEPWVTSVFAVHGNPYDGRTLGKSLSQSERLTEIKAEDAFVDRGYRGKRHHPEGTRIFISGTKRLAGVLKKLLRSHSGIEPIIGHLKKDHRLDRNYLLGTTGDNELAPSMGVELLTDIQEMFETKRIDRVSSIELIRSLCANDEKPWATYNRGSEIKPRQIANRLKEFGIISNTIRIGTLTAKGYLKSHFVDAFARYLDPPKRNNVTELAIPAF